MHAGTMEVGSLKMDVEYTIWIQGINCRQFKLLSWTSFIGQFVYPMGGGDLVKGLDREYRYFSPPRASLH